MHPIAFKIGNFPVYFYGLMMVVAYLVVLAIIPRIRQNENLDLETALDVTVYAIIGGVVGARLFYVFLNVGEYMAHPLSIINIREGGLSWHGALLGGFLGMVALARTKKISLGKLTDFAAVISALGLAIGRIGCFLNGCCYGKPSSVPWAIEFTGAGIPFHRHPTQIYESLLMFAAFFLLMAWWKKKKFNGELTLGLFMFYGIIRFIVEIFRDNTADQYIQGLPFSLAQYLSIVLVIICAAVIYIKRIKTVPQEKVQ